jgi:hypothetical protein
MTHLLPLLILLKAVISMQWLTYPYSGSPEFEDQPGHELY